MAGGVNAYSDGYVSNDLDTDTYLALCKELNMEPAITLALQYGTEREIQDARWLWWVVGMM